MQLTTLIKGLDVEWLSPRAQFSELKLSAMTDDSRQVEPGGMFIAVNGHEADGHDFIAGAIDKGAAAILVSRREAALEAQYPERCWLYHPDSRALIASLAARYYPKRPERLLGVTGTNGKSSVVHFTRQLLEKSGYAAAALGTIGVDGLKVPDVLRHSLGNTTPGTIALHKLLHQLAGHGITDAVMEVSSHGLDQGRLGELRLQAGVFTNLSQDHLDYHHTMEAYFAAKATLFTDYLAEDGIAVINTDDAYGQRLASQCEAHGINYMPYGGGDQPLACRSYAPLPDGCRVEIVIQGQQRTLHSPLIGWFQIDNILAAAGLALTCGMKPTAILDAIPELHAPPGRMERITQSASAAAVFIDYAHTPAALENILTTFRQHTAGRLIVVFGCGGDRDADKRPQMGDIASHLADIVIITDDNPRSEDPAAIRQQIWRGMTGSAAKQEIGDRYDAIASAIAMATEGDVVVVAGKGHETGQVIGSQTIPFDDRKVIEQVTNIQVKEAVS